MRATRPDIANQHPWNVDVSWDWQPGIVYHVFTWKHGGQPEEEPDDRVDTMRDPVTVSLDENEGPGEFHVGVKAVRVGETLASDMAEASLVTLPWPREGE
ncbi:hypothetical protein ABT160_23520 [Streptomyces sp. NPDC001941]|uniref:hypothetical protein n=1 Tax=Streptomyces sp. NPDC001941 TaxID=3154659 RepID=UPI00332C60D4